MQDKIKKIIEKYLGFSGEKNERELLNFHNEVLRLMPGIVRGSSEYSVLYYIKDRLWHGYLIALKQPDKKIIVLIEETEFTFEVDDKETGKKKRKQWKNRDKNLGKLVDKGEVPRSGRSDEYWKNNPMKVVFTPNNKEIRKGKKIPPSYKYADIRFIENHYGLKAIEFGNWLSQQDRANYLSGLGLALYDLTDILGFSPKQISLKGNITVAFGARGRGSAKAHFEIDTYAINITRYERPPRVFSRSRNYNRVSLLVAGGGVGSFAHEYGHALDFYGGSQIERTANGSLSGGIAIRTNPFIDVMKQSTLEGIMETILFKIIWQADGKDYSAYYHRLLDLKKNQDGYSGDYWFRRAELFARAFEVYIHYKMHKAKAENIFLQETKYEKVAYLNFKEMKKLEKDFDRLIKTIRLKLK